MNIILIGALELGLIYSIMALGLFVSYRMLDVADLTVDGSFTTGAAVCAMVSLAGHPLGGLALSIPAGMAAGLVTSLLQTKMKVQPILAGILTQMALYSINLRIMANKSNLSLLGKDSVFTMTSGWLPQSMSRAAKLPVILLMVAAICLLLAFFLKTKTGLSLRATGDNVEMVRSSSIDPHFTNALGLAIANGLVALSGAVLAQYQQYADLNMGVGMVVIALASIIIGEVIVGRRNIPVHILAVVVGSILYRLFIALALRAASPSDLKAISAAIVALAISYPAIKEMIAVAKLKRKGRATHE